jgi:hypothetical protein
MTPNFKYAEHKTEGKKTDIELHFNQINQSNQTMHLNKIVTRPQVNFVISCVSIRNPKKTVGKESKSGRKNYNQTHTWHQKHDREKNQRKEKEQSSMTSKIKKY